MRNHAVYVLALLLIFSAAHSFGQQVTGAERQVLTADAGNFVPAGVDPGEYKLTAQAPGSIRMQF